MRIYPGLNECKYMKSRICELQIINEYESDLCNNERFLSSSKKWGLKKLRPLHIWTPDFCDTGAVLHQQSEQAKWSVEYN